MESIRIIQSILTDFYLIVINLKDARYWVYEVQEREKEAADFVGKKTLPVLLTSLAGFYTLNIH